jgi:hypothetical protein
VRFFDTDASSTKLRAAAFSQIGCTDRAARFFIRNQPRGYGACLASSVSEAEGFVALAIVAGLTMGGCGPLAVLRPPAPFVEGRTKELGLGAAAVSPRPYVDEAWSQAGQLWFTGKATNWLYLSAIAAFDAEAMGAGGGARALYVRADRFSAGVDAELGYGWGAAGLPFAVRFFEQDWLYCSPRLTNYGIKPMLGVPVGLSLHLQGGGFLRLEYQSSWVDFQPYNQRNHFAAALAVQW